jgi:predicted secreted protein
MDAVFSLHKILKDSTRREILLQLNRNEKLSYMELMNLLEIKNTGRFNYHLKILDDLIEKGNDGKYKLTERGHRAIEFLENYNQKVSKPDLSLLQRLANTPMKFVMGSVLVILVCLSFFLVFTFINPSYEAPQIQWSKTYGGFAGYSVIQTPDEGFLVIGSNATYSFEARGYVDFNASILKTNSLGDLLWEETIPFGEYVIQTKDGGYAVAGTGTVTQIDNDSIQHGQFFLAKLGSQGNLLWNKTLEVDNNDDDVYSFVETDDGGYAIVGTTTYRDQYKTDALFVKTDAIGDVLWSRTYGGSEGGYAWSVIQTSDDGYAIVGTRGVSFWLIKTASNGDMQWNQTYHQNLQSSPAKTAAYARSGIATSDGGYLIAGCLSSGYDIAWVVRTDSHGSMQWNKTYGNSNEDIFNHAVQTDDGGYIFSGNSNNRAWIVKTDSKGNMQWNATYDGSVEPTGKSIVETGDGGYALVGTSSGGIWLAKIEPSAENIQTILVACAIILFVVVSIALWLYLKKLQKVEH